MPDWCWWCKYSIDGVVLFRCRFVSFRFVRCISLASLNHCTTLHYTTLHSGSHGQTHGPRVGSPLAGGRHFQRPELLFGVERWPRGQLDTCQHRPQNGNADAAGKSGDTERRRQQRGTCRLTVLWHDHHQGKVPVQTHTHHTPKARKKETNKQRKRKNQRKKETKERTCTNTHHTPKERNKQTKKSKESKDSKSTSTSTSNVNVNRAVLDVLPAFHNFMKQIAFCHCP